MEILPYVKLFPDFINVVRELDNGARGRLLLAILEYVNGEEPTELTGGTERVAFAMIKSQMDRDAAAYEAYAKRQSENGKKGGRPKKADAFFENPKNPVVFSKTHQKPKKLEKEEEKEKEEDKDKEKDEEITKKETLSDERVKKEDAFAAFAAGDGELMRALKDFEKMRKSLKKPMTDRAKQLLVNKLKRDFDPSDWIAALDQSVSKSWLDVYPLKDRQPAAGIEQHRMELTGDELEKLKATYARVKAG